jgi:hypothetical protein
MDILGKRSLRHRRFRKSSPSSESIDSIF